MNTITIERDQTIPALEEILSPEEDTTPPFTVDTVEKAAWTARKILDAEHRISQFTDQAKQYKAQIDTWFERVVTEQEASVDYFRSLLMPFIEQELTGQKSKTLKLPGLSIQLRKKPNRVEVTDKEIAISFCEANHPDALMIKKDVSKTFLKDLLSNLGELVPGCTIVLGREELYIHDS